MQADRPEYPWIAKLRAAGHDVRTGTGALSREPAASLGPPAGVRWALRRAVLFVRERWSSRIHRHADSTAVLVSRAAETTGGLARTFFGSGAYVRQVPHVDRETGELETILEVHPRCEAHTDPEWLTAQFRAFMDAFVRSVPSSQRTHVVISIVPTDADSA